MHTGYVDITECMEILTKTSSRDQVTSTLTRTSDRVNCAQNWYTSSYFQPRQRTSMREETLALIPRFWSTTPVSSTITFSKKGTPCLSLPKEPSLFFPAYAQLLQDSWHSPHCPTLHNLAPSNSKFGCVENVCFLGSVAIFCGDHQSEQRRR